ncbi:flagellar filament capping protein FliD [Actinosynnema pretiosum subsp. pretiosum]|uniref:Flagellar hook-associated protein 2 n=2 Tax=Actinosynnema TaxID=40566 RepID=C6WJR8_ACTMD|nr:flagellar filament capping protein FliD [Actinosynnema mirum]ACU36293.1 flagellar hook-associated 2 domain protein [Actinosynnema mirum DSM 43827]AXX29746.1 Flagellar hook-associated protein FliD [Actinosynnema pretiosum subsp. pretiosum]QUF06036.1 flagellar filament capping protein FliD [Actinosynnema pretiosum subsp. pretiosum]
MAAVDGLVTGLDTTSIISQLMQIEAAPKTRLQSQVSAQQRVQTAYQALNARMLAVKGAAEALNGDSTWQALKASSSSDAAVATATGNSAVAGSITFSITSLAKAHVATAQVPESGGATKGSGLEVTVGGKTTHVDVTDDTAAGVAEAVNKAGLGVRATVITTTTGQRVQFSSAKTGAEQAFTVAGMANDPTVLSQGSDATITVGDPATTGYKLTSADNNFTSVLPGVTVRATKVQNDVTVTSTVDSSGIGDKVAALVNAVNAAISTAKGYDTYDAASKTAGPLNGDTLARGLRSSLLTTVSGGGTSFGTMSAFGVALGTNGQLTFDKAKFVAAFEADPEKVRTAVTDGLVKPYKKIGEDASNSTTGSLTVAVQGGDTTLRRLNTAISEWDTKLASKKVSLQKYYSTLETSMSKLNQQASWLSGQLAGLSS